MKVTISFCDPKVWCGALLALTLHDAGAQTYPARPIRIVTSEVGGGTDLAARLVAQGLAGPLAQQLIVDNRGGSGGITGEIVAKATPDGYTMLITGSSFWVGTLFKKQAYDIARDFLPVTLLVNSPNMLIVHPSMPAKTVKELITLAKEHPGRYNYATGAAGGSPHIAAELFKSMAGVDIVRIPYKGTGLALNELVGGQVHLMFATVASAAPHVRASRLRAIAIASASPSALVPGLVTVADGGLPGYESGSMTGAFFPARTPMPIVNRLNLEMVKVLARSDIRQKFFDSGVETVGSTPNQFETAVNRELVRLGKLIRDTAMKVE